MSNYITILHDIEVASTDTGVVETNKFKNINGKDFLTKLRLCPEGIKDGSHWLRGALKVDSAGQCMARSKENIQSMAKLLIIDCDCSIDTRGVEVVGAPDPEQISRILKDNDIGHVLYGTYSHYTGEKGNRYRILLMTNTPYNNEQLSPTAQDLVALINTKLAKLGGAILAYAKENNSISQPWFYPRKPADCNIEPLCLEHLDGKPIAVVNEVELPPISHTIPRQAKPLIKGEISVIDTFNDQKKLVDILSYYGYKHVLTTSSCQRWLRPGSTTGRAGITVKDDKFFSHHSDQFNDRYWHDCWDLWRGRENLSEHDAIIEAAKNLRAPDNRTVDEFNKGLFIIKKPPLTLPDPPPTVMPFQPEMLPSAIRDFVFDVAERQQCPPDFVAITAIVTLSGLLGRKAVICPKQHDDWCVTPTQWGAIIGRPSAMKSPSMKEALKPLNKIEAKASQQYAEDKKSYDEECELIKIEKDTAKSIAKKALSKNNRDEAREALRIDDMPLPTRPRFIVNDATIEKLGELLNENSNGLILVRDELAGLLSKLLKEEYQGDRAFYLECFDGNGSFVYDRIGRGTIEIKNCILSVIGGIQPTRIGHLVRDAIKGTVDDGLIQRFQLIAWPHDIGQWMWLDRAPNKTAMASYYDVFDKVHSLTFYSEDNEPARFRFTPEAQLLFIQWMEEIQQKARTEDIHSVLESHMLKMPKTIAGLALLFEIIDGGRKSVGVEATARALEWADYLLSHAVRLYSVATNQSLDNARLILKRKSKLPDPFTVRDVQRKNWTGLDSLTAVNEALECLVEYCHLIPKEMVSTNAGGRPTIIYQWNMTTQ